MDEQTPRAFRPYRSGILALAPVLENDAYLTMSEAEFVGAVLRAAHGEVSSAWAKAKYYDLMEEAGLLE